MGALRCVDGSVLSVEAVNCRDKAGRPYEITLSLARDSVPFASVGQRCGYQLSRLAERVAAARHDPEQASDWPDPDDRFPNPDYPPPGQAGVARPGPGRAGPGLPGPSLGHDDQEYFALRSRDRYDLAGLGELRCVLRSSAVWAGECAGTGQHLRPGHWPARQPAGGHGSWQLSRRAVIEAWGAHGVGVRAVLTSAELVAFLDTVLTEPSGADASGDVPAASTQAGRQSAGKPGGISVPLWRQRGRVPDGIARSRLPALRAQARGGPVASGDTPARWGDVRR